MKEIWKAFLDFVEGLPKPETRDDWGSNQALLADWLFDNIDFKALTAHEICLIHEAAYMKVGHKFLGRLWIKLANELSEDK